ncbi:RGS domain-containing protein [Plasmodiophora brassicae]|uniref:RGS domain-containing protein n=1 Tax=Plasmodiophora brassicae TaxID=37360 RepID=A0A0G4IUF1_PLABS|nr:hypothetical protein PBRA_007014 [Plasmodiophora brassicae]SPQ92971.1 unnamed protein product [Plasmodiophora brassicae]
MEAQVVATWSVILALNCLWVIPAVHMWNRRHLEPIRSRRPRLLLATAYLTCMFVIWECVVPIFRDRITVAAYGFVTGFFLAACIETFTFFCFSLYVAYRRTLNQIRFGGESSDAKSRQWLLVSNWLLQDRVALMWVTAQSLVLFAIQLAYLSHYPKLWNMSVRAGEEDPIASGSSAFRNIAVFRVMATIVIAIVVSVLLRGVRDAFGTVEMMKKAGLSGVVGLGLFAAFGKILAQITTLDIPSMITVVTINSSLWWILARPVMDTRRVIGATTSHTSRIERNKEAFEKFLTTPEGFTAFKAHLQTEFSVESLLFWAAVRKFRSEFTKENGLSAARSIYNDFLALDAPLQINVSGSSLNHFKGIFEKAGSDQAVNANMFDNASDQMIDLMEANSLARFRNSNQGRLWTKFKEKHVPMQVVLSEAATEELIRHPSSVPPAGISTSTLQPAVVQAKQ